MSQDKKQYVYRLMKAECSCGSKDFQQYLNLPEDHGITFSTEDQPLMNASDHVANENILQFGRCTSLTNPNGLVGTSMVAGLFAPMGPLAGVLAGTLAKKVAGVKCEPMTLVPWINVDEDYFIDGVPALTIESKLPCYYGGTISIYLEKEEDAEAESDESDEEPTVYDKTDQLPSEVQEQLESFTDITQIKQEREDAAKAKAAAKEAAEEAERQKRQAMLEKWNEMLKDPQQYMYNRDLEGIDLNGMSIKEKESSLPSLKSVEELQLDINKKGE